MMLLTPGTPATDTELISAVKLSIGSTTGFHNHGEGPYYSWLKAATTAFSFKTLLRHYAKQALTPR